MVYRRYGYKAPDGNEGGAYDKYVLFRFAVVVISFLCYMLSTAYQGKMFAGLYFISGLAFLLLGFSAEFASRIKNSLVLIFSIASIAVAVHYKEDLFNQFMHTYNAGTGRWIRYSALNESVLNIFIGYNILMAVLSFFLIPPSFIPRWLRLDGHARV